MLDACFATFCGMIKSGAQSSTLGTSRRGEGSAPASGLCDADRGLLVPYRGAHLPQGTAAWPILDASTAREVHAAGMV